MERSTASIGASAYTLVEKHGECQNNLLVGHTLPLLFRNGRYDSVDCKSTQLFFQKAYDF